MPKSPAFPYFELRIGGFRVTADSIPVRLVTALTTALATGWGTWWWAR
ncbi:hypothetical protein ACFH04_28445 [Streptomyces noboritoensis]|uniref:Uncharacterized protein n=1 Tax=Streptomyces noboritoensis TaxID=67337 RepID=A0ABV6TPA7_9ACTN